MAILKYYIIVLFFSPKKLFFNIGSSGRFYR